eukprot:gnl/MRDRNA2_/MRDRNA2_99282_c0_seq1.p1 gnl/MRDRNA2_/MRDRNA2_99282_c0~~gnl/MRDRNA2_/MRDRNA2_99282_c0_seq1.p1  ORF type:complete len:1003 (+),score=147.50 gnl/MRDRNA2_/MRDRNA2_99282_c0_seq1:109-3117(+)
MILPRSKFILLACTLVYANLIAALEHDPVLSYPDVATARRRRRTMPSFSGRLDTMFNSAQSEASVKNPTFIDGSLIAAINNTAPTAKPGPKLIYQHSRPPPPACTAVFVGLMWLGLIQILRYRDRPQKRLEVSYDEDGQEVKDCSDALAVMRDETVVIVRRLHGKLAFRIGVSCLVGAAPLVVPALFAWFKDMKYSPAMLGAGVIWTYQRNLGMTIIAVKDSIIGILLAFLFIWIAGGIWPGGVIIGGPSHVWYCGMLYAILTTTSVLWLNLPMVVRLYCLPYHLAYMMHFLKPKAADAPSLFSRHFGLDIQCMAFGYVVVTILGGIMSVLASCLPTPIMAHRTAMAKLTSTSKAFCIMYKSLVHEYVRPEQAGIQSIMERNKVFVKSTALSLAEMDAYIQASWWEHFDRGKYRQIRFYLESHVRMSGRLLDRVRAAQNRIVELSPTDARKKLMAELKVPLEDLVKQVLDLFEKCTHATMDGVIDASEKQSFISLVKQVEKQTSIVNDKLMAASQRIAGDSFSAKHALFARDYCIIYIFMGLAHIVVDFAKILSQEQPAMPERGLWIASVNWCKGVFQNLTETNHCDFALRNSCSLILSFACGYVGFLDLVPKYTSDIACQTSMLLSTFIGSGMQKNLRRFQGVTLGCFVGFALNRIYCWSGAYGPVLLFSQFAYTAMMYHIFLSNNDVGYSCYLSAVWASISMNNVCPSHTELDPVQLEGPVSTGGQMRVLGILLATFFIGVVDLLLAHQTASSEAIKTYTKFLEECDNSIKRWFTDSVCAHEGVRHGFKFLQQVGPSQLEFVSARSEEAVMEPTYWHKRPWNQQQFLNFQAMGHRLRLNILTMEWALLGIGVSNGLALELADNAKDSSVTDLIKIEKEREDEMLHLFENTEDFTSIKKRIMMSYHDLLHEVKTAMNSDSEEQIEKECKSKYLEHKPGRPEDEVSSRFEKFTGDLSKVVASLDMDKKLGKHGAMRLHIATLMLEVTQEFILNMQYQTYVDC